MNHPKLMTPLARQARRASQRGVSLLFALLALGAMMLAAVALVRSVDSGAMVLGNLGFKQDATSASDHAAERARAWLLSAANLTVDSPTEGYYATSQDNLDVTGRLTTAAAQMAVIDWGDADSCACLPATCSSCTRTPNNIDIPINGGLATARYLITRLCPSTGVVSAANACARPASLALSVASYRGEQRVGGGAPPSPAATTPYYRIIVRTKGARGTVSFTETVIH